MKKILLIMASVCGLLMIPSCADISNQMDPDYPADYDINYTLKSVTEIDPVNINGIDVYPYFDFFKSLKFVIHVTDGKMTSFEFENGDIPFSPFSFELPDGKVECWYDSQSSPNALRLKDSNEVIALFSKGELYIPFQLDCKEINYEYRFKEITE